MITHLQVLFTMALLVLSDVILVIEYDTGWITFFCLGLDWSRQKSCWAGLPIACRVSVGIITGKRHSVITVKKSGISKIYRCVVYYM